MKKTEEKNPEEVKEEKEEQTEQEERSCSDQNEEKETTITGECIFCHTFREVPYHLTCANAKMRGITSLVFDFQGFRIVAFAAALLAGHIDTREIVHLYGQH